jgi:hypothetical protein
METFWTVNTNLEVSKRLRSPDLGARKFWSSQKKHVRTDKGKTSRSSFLSAKQRESALCRQRESVPSADRSVGRQKKVLSCKSQDLQLLLGPVDMGCSFLENWVSVSFTPRDWILCNELLPHVGQENSWPWMVRTGLGAVILHRL